MKEYDKIEYHRRRQDSIQSDTIGYDRIQYDKRQALEKLAKARRARSSNAFARSVRSSRSVRSAISFAFASQRNANATTSESVPPVLNPDILQAGRVGAHGRVAGRGELDCMPTELSA